VTFPRSTPPSPARPLLTRILNALGWYEWHCVGWRTRHYSQANDLRARIEVAAARPELMRGMYPSVFKVWLRVKP
jgi:hypothetical protein